MENFSTFLNKQDRESRRQLKIVKSVFESAGMKVKDFTTEDDPYIFLRNPDGTTFFEGVRIYAIAGMLAFRVQNEEKTHPYGKAYKIDLPEMFSDYLSDDIKEEQAGKQVMKTLQEEFRKFFKKSAKADADFSEPTALTSRINLNTSSTDYSNLITNGGF